IFGFDPRLQFVHEDDVVGALMYATVHDVPGVYNVAGDGVVPWSEVCKIVAKRRVAPPPFLTRVATGPLRMPGVVNLPPELLDLLRFGRGLDTTRFQRAGYRYRYTTAGAVEAFARGLRLKNAVGEKNPTYKYQREIEDFFRHSSAVVRNT